MIMKKLLFILFLIMGTTISCTRNSTPPRNYDIEIQVSDLNNNDLIKGVGYYPTSSYMVKDYKYYRINESYFDCISKTKNISVNSLINPANDPQTIVLLAYSPPHRPDVKPTEVKLEMVCPNIFNDDEKHEIITKWSYEKDTYCTSLSIDGKEHIVTYDESKHIYRAKIVLDR